MFFKTRRQLISLGGVLLLTGCVINCAGAVSHLSLPNAASRTTPSPGDEVESPIATANVPQRAQSSPHLLARSEFTSLNPVHPMHHNRTVLYPLPEILLFGRDSGAFQGDLNGFVYDDVFAGFAEIAQWDANDDGERPDICWGDFDGDGKLEYVLAADVPGMKLGIWIRDDSDTNFAQMHAFHPETASRNGYPTVAAGDFDSDGADEFVLAYIESQNITIQVWEQRPTTSIPAGPQIILPFFSESMDVDFASDERSRPDCAVGDFNGDGDNEFVVMLKDGIANFHGFVYDYIMGEYQVIHTFREKTGTNYNRITTGDVDGDLVDEIILIGSEGYGGALANLKAWIFDDEVGDWEILKTWNRSDMKAQKPVPAAGDVDRDGKDEIVFYSIEWDGQDSRIWVFDDHATDFTELMYQDVDDNWGKADVVFADLNLSGEETLVIAFEAHHREYGNVIMLAFGTWRPYRNIFDYDYRLEPALGTSDPVLALGDADRDGIVMEYVEPASPFSVLIPPRIINVVAAPPYIRGIKQQADASFTSLGTTEEIGTVESRSITMSESVKLGWGYEDPFKILKAEISTTLARGMSTTFSTATSIARSQYYICGYNENSVIFATTEMQRYNYRLVSHPRDPDQIGTIVTLEFPTQTMLYKWELSQFDHEYPEFQMERVFNHTIGEACTYPTLEEYADIAPQPASNPVWWTDSTPVGSSKESGKLGCGISVGSQETTTQQRTISVSFSGSLSTLGMSVALTKGFGTSTAYSLTIGESYSYSGYVGDITDWEDYQTYNYSYGLIVYTHHDPELEIVYQVVNYWVHGAKPGPEFTTAETTTAEPSTENESSLSNYVNQYFQLFPSIGGLPREGIGIAVLVLVVGLTLLVFRRKK